MKAYNRKILRRALIEVESATHNLEDAKAVARLCKEYAYAKTPLSPSQVKIIPCGEMDFTLQGSDWRENLECYLNDLVNSIREKIYPLLPAIPNDIEAKIMATLCNGIKIPSTDWHSSSIATVDGIRQNFFEIKKKLDFLCLEIDSISHSGLHRIDSQIFAAKDFSVIIKKGIYYPQAGIERRTIMKMLCEAHLTKKRDVLIERLLTVAFGSNHTYGKSLKKALGEKGLDTFENLIELSAGDRGGMARLKIN